MSQLAALRSPGQEGSSAAFTLDPSKFVVAAGKRHELRLPFPEGGGDDSVTYTVRYGFTSTLPLNFSIVSGSVTVLERRDVGSLRGEVDVEGGEVRLVWGNEGAWVRPRTVRVAGVTGWKVVEDM